MYILFCLLFYRQFGLPVVILWKALTLCNQVYAKDPDMCWAGTVGCWVTEVGTAVLTPCTLQNGLRTYINELIHSTRDG
jgi:hypothetical protein